MAHGVIRMAPPSQPMQSVRLATAPLIPCRLISRPTLAGSSVRPSAAAAFTHLQTIQLLRTQCHPILSSPPAVRRLEEVAKAVGGGYRRLQLPLSLALAVRETAAGHRLGALEGGGGLTPFQCIPACAPLQIGGRFPQFALILCTLTGSDVARAMHRPLHGGPCPFCFSSSPGPSGPVPGHNNTY